MGTDTDTAIRVHWAPITIGAALVLVALINAARAVWTPEWAIIGAVLVGGALLLYGLLRTFGTRRT